VCCKHSNSYQAVSDPRGWQRVCLLVTVNFIIYYGTRFFLTSGIKDPFLITMITNIVAFVSTIPGLYLVETMGRRNLLLAGAVGMTVCQVIVGAVGVSTDSQVSNIVLIVFVCFYLFFFEFSWGP